MSTFISILGLPMGAAAALLALPLPVSAQPAVAGTVARDPIPDAVAGDYVHSEMELVAGIRLAPDGSFQYGLTVGSLDERAQGRWKRVGARIELTSTPRPVAPEIVAGPVEQAPGEPFAIRLLAPNGQDIPGIDLLIGFDKGEPLESYVAGGPWSLPAGEGRVPQSVTFFKRAYRIQSARLPLRAQAGTIATFRLIPNDFGVVDLTGAYLEADGTDLILHRPEGEMRFRRSKD
ncbi:hypothetical protein ACG3SL_14025 [Sphingomonas sp. CJ20]